MNVQQTALGRAPAVAIVGATGAVGAEFVGCLERRGFPLSSLRLLASARSAGKRVAFRGREIEVETLTERSFDGIDIALFSAGSAISRQYAPIAVRAGATVVDNSSAFRMDEGVPLVIPEVNPEAIARHRGIIANPNCVVIVAMTPLWPLHRVNPIRRIVLASYQAASGGGAAMMEELRQATKAHLADRPFAPKVLKHDYAFNLFSHNTKVDLATGYNEEETKVVNETRKIFAAPALQISPTCIRVPVLRAHAAALTVECERPITPEEVRAIMGKAQGVRVVDDRINNHFPMPKDASGQDDILVGRIRQDIGDPSGRTVALFVAGDQLLKGAALNAVQIAERLPIALAAAA
ncbi:MAG TPA: aspartate-semialdehyde dehydrogenase [Alphaproteobacteria bacterium]|nr:aspartate-semialdehyde dehydrogenase [Alphaproteobacteria bacterium]